MRSSGLLPLAVFAAALSVSQQAALGQFAITTASLPNAPVNVSYNQQLTTNAQQSIVLAWSITSRALPPGLALGPASGLIGGTPTGGAFQMASLSWRIKIAPFPLLPAPEQSRSRGVRFRSRLCQGSLSVRPVFSAANRGAYKYSNNTLIRSNI